MGFMTTPRRSTSAEDRPDRKTAILLAAEKLFAKHGYDGVSLRQIADEAAVQLALVDYYFGQKHDLFEAVFARWRGTIDQRLASLKEAMRAAPAERLQRLVDAFLQPVLRLRASSEGEYYALMVARELYNQHEHADHVMRAYFDPMAHAFIDALHVALPHARREDAAWVYQFMLGALLHHLRDDRIARLSRNRCKPADPAAAPMLTRFIVGGIVAALPVPSRTSTRRRKTP